MNSIRSTSTSYPVPSTTNSVGPHESPLSRRRSAERPLHRQPRRPPWSWHGSEPDPRRDPAATRRHLAQGECAETAAFFLPAGGAGTTGNVGGTSCPDHDRGPSSGPGCARAASAPIRGALARPNAPPAERGSAPSHGVHGEGRRPEGLIGRLRSRRHPVLRSLRSRPSGPCGRRVRRATCQTAPESCRNS